MAEEMDFILPISGHFHILTGESADAQINGPHQ